MVFLNKSKWYFASFILGSALGSGIALLYAPESGKRVRKEIRKKTNKMYKEGKKKAFNTWIEAREIAENAYEDARDFINSSVNNIVGSEEKSKGAHKSVAHKSDTKSR